MNFPHRLETFDLPAFWASYFINGDASGLTDAEQRDADAWWAENLPADVPVSCVDCSEDPDFRRYHDADRYVLPCDCLTYTFLVHEAAAAREAG